MTTQADSQVVAPEDDPKVLDLVRSGILQVQQGQITLADLMAAAVGVETLPEPSRVPVPTAVLTDDEKDALKRLPDIFGKTVVASIRKLSAAELRDIVIERETIDLLLKVLEKRKDKAIREVLANHLDMVLDEDQRKTARKGGRGDCAVAQEVSVPGTGKKVQRTVSGGKPVLAIADIEALHAEGKIDRATYLKITKKPDLPRVLDEAGLHAAIQKDPRLFFLLTTGAKETTPTTTIKVQNDT